MNETEWLSCSDPELMLDFLRAQGSERKLRLFACACCREPEVWHYLPHRASRNAVQAAERFADGKATREELLKAVAAAPKGKVKGGPWNAWYKVHLSSQGQADRAVLATSRASAWEAARETTRLVVNFVEWRRQCDLLRDIFGNLFYPSSALPIDVPPVVADLVQTIYVERAFARMPDLADALEKCVCVNSEITSHFRGPGPHVRGCWAMDLLLGKV